MNYTIYYPTISICGNMAFFGNMQNLKKQLEEIGFKIYIPDPSEQDLPKLETNSKALTKSQKKSYFIKRHLEKIKNSSSILVANYKKHGIPGYIGGNTLMEIAYAFAENKDIFILNKLPPKGQLTYLDEITGTMPVVLNQDQYKVKEYYDNLPKVLVASTNYLKLQAVDFAFRKFDQKVQPIGVKVSSGISEQPLTLEETFTGALNRLKILEKFLIQGSKSSLPANIKENTQYIVSIESGNQKFEFDNKLYASSITLIKPVNTINTSNTSNNKENATKPSSFVIGIVIDPPMPEEFIKLVPSKYPDFGVLVQQKYGIEQKDPYIYLSNGKLTRRDLIVDSIVRALVQMVGYMV